MSVQRARLEVAVSAYSFSQDEWGKQSFLGEVEGKMLKKQP